MTTSRLNLALDSGEIGPLEGEVAVLNAPGDLIYSGFTETLTASQSFYPDYARLQSRGATVSAVLTDPVANTLVICHRSKAATLNLIAHAIMLTKIGGAVCVDGAKTTVIASVLNDMR